MTNLRMKLWVWLWKGSRICVINEGGENAAHLITGLTLGLSEGKAPTHLNVLHFTFDTTYFCIIMRRIWRIFTEGSVVGLGRFIHTGPKTWASIYIILVFRLWLRSSILCVSNVTRCVWLYKWTIDEVNKSNHTLLAIFSVNFRDEVCWYHEFCKNVKLCFMLPEYSRSGVWSPFVCLLSSVHKTSSKLSMEACKC
jgi:hypothetical protein